MQDTWIKQSDREPTMKDLPFITYGKSLSRFPKSEVIMETQDLWEDTDWFFELTEAERLEWVYWQPVVPPKKK